MVPTRRPDVYLNAMHLNVTIFASMFVNFFIKTKLDRSFKYFEIEDLRFKICI